MIVGNPKIKVTRTDLSRYLNEHSEQFPELSKYWEEYMSKCGRARKEKASQFGFWIRTKNPKVFDKIFKWSQKNLEILDAIYSNTDSTIETL